MSLNRLPSPLGLVLHCVFGCMCACVCVREREGGGSEKISLRCRGKGLAQILTIIGTTLFHCAVGTDCRYTGRTIVVISHRQSSANARVRNPGVGTRSPTSCFFLCFLLTSFDELGLPGDRPPHWTSSIACHHPDAVVKATWPARRSWRHFGASGTCLLVVAK